MTNSQTPHPVDIHVGKVLRQRRKLAGITQEKLAVSVGLTFQQIQKYEMGKNRVSASRLYQFSQLLDTPVSVFFEGYNPEHDSIIESISTGSAEKKEEKFDLMKAPETIKLVRTYYSINDEKLRRSIYGVMRNVSRNLSRRRK